jgi:hypothetical protein
LIIIYQLEVIDFKFAAPIIVGIHWFFLVCGLMAVGLPSTYVVKKLYDKLVLKLPEKLLFWTEESRKRYPTYHGGINRVIWLTFVPFTFGAIITFMIPIITGTLDTFFYYIFYVAPIVGAFYLSLTDFLERKMGIIK